MNEKQMTEKPLIVLAAGGTGGHVFPAEALAQTLLERGYRLALITDSRGHNYGGQLGALDTYSVKAGGVAGRGILGRVFSALALGFGAIQARSLLQKLRPAAVIGFGGYASVPTMAAATMLKIPCALHEQNAVLGRANRLFAPKVTKIALSFEVCSHLPAGSESKTVHTGMPVRPAVLARHQDPYQPFGPADKIEILVLGGSQGAQVFSDVLPEAFSRLSADLRARLHITQQCRPEFLEATRDAYQRNNINADLSDFFKDVPELLGKAHLLIARAGASTVAELTVMGRPAILVPYPHAIDDHQTRNAHAVDEAGAGWLMPQTAFTPETLATRLQSLLSEPITLTKIAAASRKAGRFDAALRLADLVEEMIGATHSPETKGNS